MNANQIWEEVQTAVRRAVRSDFNREHATEQEREQLSHAPLPLTDPLVQNYAVWRKAMMWIGSAALCVLMVTHLVTYETSLSQMASTGAEQAEEVAKQQGDTFSDRDRERAYENAERQIKEVVTTDNLDLMDGVQVTLLLTNLIGTVLIVIGAVKWSNLPASKRMLRLGWLVMFITPFVLAAIPISSMFDWDHLEKYRNQGVDPKQVKQLFGMGMAFFFFAIVGPKALSLFPGIMRSSMTLKTLLPEASMPGWAAVLVAPLYALFLIVVMSLVIQIQGDLYALLGILFLIAGGLVYVLKAKDVLEPHSSAETTTLVINVRRTAALFNVLGGIILGVFLLQSDFFGVDGAIKFGLTFLGSVVILTVVASDFVLALIWSGYQQSKRFQGTELQKVLETKFEALSAVGLTDLRAPKGPDGRDVGGRQPAPPQPAPAPPPAAASPQQKPAPPPAKQDEEILEPDLVDED